MRDKENQPPERPAQNSEAHSSQKPTKSVGAPTTGSAIIDNLRCAVLTERARVRIDLIRDFLDQLMNLPGLSTRITKQALIAWLMIEHSSLPYHEPPEPTFSETLLDVVLDLLSGPLRRNDPNGGGDGGTAETGEAETTVLPQPVGPETPSIGVPVDLPKVEKPPTEKMPRTKQKRAIDPDMER